MSFKCCFTTKRFHKSKKISFWVKTIENIWVWSNIDFGLKRETGTRRLLILGLFEGYRGMWTVPYCKPSCRDLFSSSSWGCLCESIPQRLKHHLTPNSLRWAKLNTRVSRSALSLKSALYTLITFIKELKVKQIWKNNHFKLLYLMQVNRISVFSPTWFAMRFTLLSLPKIKRPPRSLRPCFDSSRFQFVIESK